MVGTWVFVILFPMRHHCSKSFSQYISLIFTTSLGKRNYLHFTDKETEARVVKERLRNLQGRVVVVLKSD